VLSPVKMIDSEQQRPDDIVSIINSVFNNRKTFSCPKIKQGNLAVCIFLSKFFLDLVTGTSISNLSPEDIGVIAAMGDSLATGIGLWPRFYFIFQSLLPNFNIYLLEQTLNLEGQPFLLVVMLLLTVLLQFQISSENLFLLIFYTVSRMEWAFAINYPKIN
jgi:hypothetical protein